MEHRKEKGDHSGQNKAFVSHRFTFGGLVLQMLLLYDGQHGLASSILKLGVTFLVSPLHW